MTSKQKLALIATILGSGIVILDGTVVNVALPAIARDLNGSFNDLQWIVDSYLLTLSALILIGGSLSDILGRKRVYIFGLVGFGITSMLCGLAPNIKVLIAIRAIQGVFGALLVPGALAIINTNFQPSLRGKAIGRWSAWAGITTAFGPPLGGFLVDNASWRWIFLINLPLVVVCLLLARSNIVESKDKVPRKIDYIGAGLAVLALGTSIYGLIEGPARHWDKVTIITILSGLILAIAFLIYESKQKDPMVQLSLFKSRNFSGANIATFAMYGALGGFIFGLVLYLQSVAGFSGSKAGITLLPVSLLILTLSSRVGSLAGKYGPRVFMTVGPILAGLGMLILLNLKAPVNYFSDLLPGILLFGLGLALTVSPLTITVMSAVKQDDSGIASGVNNAVSRVAGLIVVALLGLFGVAESYRFTILLCGSLAISAGLISFALIRNPTVKAKA